LQSVIVDHKLKHSKSQLYKTSVCITSYVIMACSGQFPPTQTMFSDIILKTKNLLNTICVPALTTFLFPVKTLKILYPEDFTQLCLVPFMCLIFSQLFNYLSSYVLVLYSRIYCTSQLHL